MHSAAMSVEELFASGTSLPTFPASSTNAVQTLEKLLAAMPQSQIVFNSPIKEVNCLFRGTLFEKRMFLQVSGEDSGMSNLGTGPNTSTPAYDLDGTAPGTTPDSSPSLHEHKLKTEKRSSPNADMDEELHSLQLKDNNLVDKVGFTKEEGKEVEVLEPIVPMRISPDIEKSEAPAVEEAQTCANNHDVEEDMEDIADNEVDSLKPSPNISTDFEESSSPSKSVAQENKNRLDSNMFVDNNPTLTPNTNSSLNRVRDYIQSLPSPRWHPSKRGGSDTDDIPGDLKTNLSMAEEETNNSSQCSDSLSLISRHSNVSSVTGARMGRGMFYGAGPTTCSFPEEWNQIIPESIENDDDVD